MNASIFGLILGGALLAAPPQTAASLDDAKILGVLDVASEGEIQQGDLAVSRAQTPAVKAFARTMVEDHTSARNEGRSVANRIGVEMSPSAVSNDLKEDNNQVITLLRPTPKARFDHAYMDAQVTGHKKLRELIDERLTAAAQSSEVKAFLGDARKHVQRHLDAAEKTLKKVDSKTP